MKERRTSAASVEASAHETIARARATIGEGHTREALEMLEGASSAFERRLAGAEELHPRELGAGAEIECFRIDALLAFPELPLPDRCAKAAAWGAAVARALEAFLRRCNEHDRPAVALMMSKFLLKCAAIYDLVADSVSPIPLLEKALSACPRGDEGGGDGADCRRIRGQILVKLGKLHLLNADYGAAGVCFQRAEELARGMMKDHSGREEDFGMLRAKALLGLADCRIQSAPGFTWDGKGKDAGICTSMIDAEEDLQDALASVGELEKTRSGDPDVLLLNSEILFALAKARDRIFTYEYSSEGREEYFTSDSTRSWPDKEYDAVAEMLRPLAAQDPGRYEPALLDVLGAKADWLRRNCSLTDNPYLFGGGAYDPEDAAGKLQGALDLMRKVVHLRRRHLADNPHKGIGPFAEAVDALAEFLLDGGETLVSHPMGLRLHLVGALEPELVACAEAAGKLAERNPSRYGGLARRTEDALRRIREFLEKNGAAALPGLLWHSPQFADRERWDGVRVGRGAEFAEATAGKGAVAVPAADWQLPLAIVLNPALMQDEKVRARFQGLLKLDGKGRYEDSWESAIVFSDAAGLVGSVNPWAFVLMFRPGLACGEVEFARFNGYSACRLLENIGQTE